MGQPGFRPNREVRGAHLGRDIFLDVLARLAGSEDADIPIRDEGRNKEGQTTYMVPVVMGQDNQEFPDVLLFHHLVAKGDYAGTGVAQQDVVIDADFHA